MRSHTPRVIKYTSLAQWNQSNGFLPRVSGVRVSQGVPKRKERSMVSFGLCASTRIRRKPNTYTSLVQWNRTCGYGPQGHGFKSSKAYQLPFEANSRLGQLKRDKQLRDLNLTKCKYSSVGQSVRLIRGRSLVRSQLLAPTHGLSPTILFVN